MIRQKVIPIALTIAGSDSGGGAGIQADLKTFAALGIHGTSAITCITAQNPKCVANIQPCEAGMVRQQLETVFEELRPVAVKTGMLYSAEIIEQVADFFSRQRSGDFSSSSVFKNARFKTPRLPALPPLIIDPVMVSTSGARLLKKAALTLLIEKLLPLATLITPNLDEAELLLSRKLKNINNLRAAAKELHERFGCAALVKGGHLRTGKDAVDIFFDGRNELMLSAPFIHGVNTHGTGCTYSTAITAYLAHGHVLPLAVELAKEHITQAIRQHQIAAGHSVLNNFWR